MVEIAFTDNQDTIYRLDLETLKSAKFFGAQAGSIAIGPMGLIFLAGRPSITLRWIPGTPSDPSSFEFGTDIYIPDGVRIHNVNAVRVRPVDFLGNYRIYFSEAHGAGGDGYIYYLDKSFKPVLYYTVEIDKILNWCNCCGNYDIPYWGGNFTFDDKNNLYLSNGNTPSSSIYVVRGAGLDGVSGQPARLYTMHSDLPIYGMQFLSPKSLLFSTGEKIFRLTLEDIGPVSTEFVFEYEPPSLTTRRVTDLALMTSWWPYAAKKAAFSSSYYPGTTSVGLNRQKHMAGRLDRFRDIPESDVVAIMGHRIPGADYPSIHPPLSEISEPYCPVRQLVAPTPGADAGDRIRYSQWVDSMYFAPATPYWRSYWGAINCRGCDPGALSGRQIMEARERDIEVYTKMQMDTEMFEPARSAMRGCTVHGHSLRLEENGLMFDMLKRVELGEDRKVYQVKDQVGIPLDRKIALGWGLPDSEAKKRTTIFREDGIPLSRLEAGSRKYDEAVEALHHMWELRTRWGFRPE